MSKTTKTAVKFMVICGTKLTESQFGLLIRAAKAGPAGEAGTLSTVKQLEAKGLVTRAGGSLGVNERHEWGRLKATLHNFILTPAGRALMERHAFTMLDASFAS